MGLAISAATLQNSLKRAMPAEFAWLADSSYNIPNFDTLKASPAQVDEILHAYAHASRTVFIMNVPFMALCLLGCLLIKDRGLQRPEEVKVTSDKDVIVTNGSLDVEEKANGSSEKPVPDSRGSDEAAEAARCKS